MMSNRSYTLVARGRTGKGHRFMFEASSLAKAEKAGLALCRKEQIEFVAVFPGHMAALKVIRKLTKWDIKRMMRPAVSKAAKQRATAFKAGLRIHEESDHAS